MNMRELANRLAELYCLKEIEAEGFKQLGTGASRRAFYHPSIPDVAFKLQAKLDYSTDHAKLIDREGDISNISEIRVWLNASPEARKHLAKILFFTKNRRVIVQERADEAPYEAYDAFRHMLEDKLEEEEHYNLTWDLHCGNVGITKDGAIKLVDFQRRHY